MSHRLLTLLLLSACFLGMNVSAWAQNAVPVHGIRGYLDPRTRIFHSIPQLEAADAAEPPATTTFTGSFVFNFTITVNSTIASTGVIGCVAGASLLDGTTNQIVEIAGTALTRGSGKTITCSVTVPYSWKLTTASTDKIRLSYSITSPVNFSTPAGEYPKREGSQSLGTIAVPVTGTTTTETVTATI